MRNIYKRLILFFPIALVIIHFKRNHLLLLFWLLLFGIVSKKVGTFYGVHHLFLAPEYLGQINYIAYGIIGLMVGSFIVAFNIYSYQLNILVFPFMATVAKPFIKYTYNNSIIPLLFIGVYVYNSVKFQYTEELIPAADILFNIVGFLTGILTFIILAYIYFLKFDKNIYKISGLTAKELEQYRTSYDKKVDGLAESKIWERRLKRIGPWKIQSYLSKPFKIGLARKSDHYNRQLIKLFFIRNHVNASIFEIGVISTFIFLGLLREEPLFMIPAGASILVLLSLILMLVSTFYSFFKRWSMTVIVLSIIAVNLFTTEYDIFTFRSYAYGLNYNTEKADYSEEKVYDLANDKQAYFDDKNKAIQILKNWKKQTKKRKPKLIVLNTSGGGSRSALWTLSTLQYLDSVFEGEFSSQLQFISGASGGMIGATYFRELYLNSQLNNDDNYLSKQHQVNISNDILNPIAFSVTSADLLPRFQEYNDGKYTYTKDRGYIFEKVLNQNLDNTFKKRLIDYKEDEKNGVIPMIVYSPTIAQENRRMLISPQPLSYLTYSKPESETGYRSTAENIEFTKLFKEQDANNIHISSAVRMSATFPYILPLTHLPSEPQIKLMDAGGRDNYGVKISYRYLFELKDWINRNTSGVIVLNIRDTENKMKAGKKETKNSIQNTLLTPISLPFQNFFGVQDFINDENFRYLAPNFKDIQQINFCLSSSNKVSLNFHLTKKDKQLILNEINSDFNQASLKKIKELLK